MFDVIDSSSLLRLLEMLRISARIWNGLHATWFNDQKFIIKFKNAILILATPSSLRPKFQVAAEKNKS